MSHQDTRCNELAHVLLDVNKLLKVQGISEIMNYLQANDISMPRYMVLHLLETSEGVTISETATQLHLTLGSTSQLIDRLEQDGYVSRHDDDDDRRIKRIFLLEKGRTLVEEVRTIRIQSLQHQLGKLPESTIASLLHVCSETRDLLRKESQ